jgi:predicted site-specific integrase-resolvase
MPNERLRAALMAKRLTPLDLSTDIGVDPKTVERWIAQGRIPYPRYRHAIAARVEESESYLWPDALKQERQEQPDQAK